MKSNRLLLVIAILISFGILFIGCDSAEPDDEEPSYDPEASKVKSDEAYDLMEGQFSFWVNGSFETASDFDALQFIPANNLYKDALELDPENLDANLGAAITEILIAYADPEMNQMIKDMEASFNDRSFSKILNRPVIPTTASALEVPVAQVAQSLLTIQKAALVDPPLISEVQRILRDNFVPKINYSIERLAVCETNPEFRFEISGNMQGDSDLDPVAIYRTELYLTDAVLHAVKFAMEVFLMYNFTLPDYEQTTILNAIRQDNTTFFVLASDGAARAANAKNELNTCLSKITDGINSLESYSGGLSDAILRIGEDGIYQNDLDSVKKYLDYARDAINNNVTVHIPNADSHDNSYDVTFNIGNFFNSPAANPKAAYLPSYSVSAVGTDKWDIDIKFDAETYDDFVFPDPTFGGFLPGMDNETLKRLLWIDDEYGYTIHGWVSFDHSYYGDVANATVTITHLGNSYSDVTDEWGDFEIIITDVTTSPILINGAQIDYGEGTKTLYFDTTSDIFHAQAKKSVWVQVNIPDNQPSGLYAETSPSEYVLLRWSSSYSGYFVIERDNGTGTFTDRIYKDYFSSSASFYDYDVTPGTTYYYRVRTSWWGEFSDDYYADNYMRTEELYSNTISVTP